MSYYFMHNWLQNYQYRAELSWWIFARRPAQVPIIITLINGEFPGN